MYILFLPTRTSTYRTTTENVWELVDQVQNLISASDHLYKLVVNTKRTFRTRLDLLEIPDEMHPANLESEHI